MNYGLHYDLLISRALTRDLDGFFEIHHIVPCCMGGSDDFANLVKLTPEEHFVAHQLLVKMHPNHAGLVYSLSLMSGAGTKTPCRNNKLYSWLRKKLSMPKSDEHKEKISASMMGKIKTDEHKVKISESLKGRSKGPLSEEHKAKISYAISNIPRGPCSEETKKKIGNSNKGNNSFTLECPMCGFVGKGSVMYRHHFTNCKRK